MRLASGSRPHGKRFAWARRGKAAREMHEALWLISILQIAVATALYARAITLSRLVVQRLPAARVPLLKGHPAPPFALTEPRTGSVVFSSEFLGETVMLLFVSPACQHCRALVGSLHIRQSGTDARTVLLCRGTESECFSLHSASLRHRLLVDDGQAAAQYGVGGFPTAVLVGRDWRIIGYRHVMTMDALREAYAVAAQG